MKIKGVNLGNWLVLEKWMSPELYYGTNADDEDALAYALDSKSYESRIKTHRSEYITERDFVRIKGMGMNMVRIPVPFFIFGDRAPFIGCIDELDKAFNWAERYGLKILIDLHTAPESQNGFDNGGVSGVCKWAQLPDEVEFELSVLERLAQRYGNRTGLYGIEAINEPITERMWEIMNPQKRYPNANPERAKGSKGCTYEFLEDFYYKAYERIRKHMGEEKAFVIHDAFDLTYWKNFMQDKSKYKNVVLDTHQYLMAAEMMGCKHELDSYVEFIQKNYAEPIKEMSKYFTVICGEWCLFNSLACGYDTKGGQSALNGVSDEGRKVITDEEKAHIYKTLSTEQLKAWDNGEGYFYWNYKLLTDTVNTEGWSGWEAWDADRCVNFGWFDPNEKL